MEVLIFIVIVSVLYTLGFVIPAQLKDISKQLGNIEDLLKDRK